MFLSALQRDIQRREEQDKRTILHIYIYKTCFFQTYVYEKKMHLLSVVSICLSILTCVSASLITYDQVRGTPYKVGYDHRAVTINGIRTMLISGAIHYPRSTTRYVALFNENGQKIRDLIQFKPMHFGIFMNKNKVSLEF